MAHDDHARWRNAFHLTPPTGWLNDPNGLCQYRGTYHVFHQYSPDWPAPDAARGWGHFTSRDLVRWEHHGMVVAPDTPDEASGSYSGCAVEGDDGRLRLYYTGNVKEPGDFDYVHDGRRSVQILVESPDGYRMGKKSVLLRNADYPAFCTRHVRDPKVWREGGAWWMILGARDVDDRGLVLVLRSDDGLRWENAGTVRPAEPFGYMWECPDRVELEGREWLSFCPQGMQGLPWANGIRDQAGYVPVAAGSRVSEGAVVDAGAFRRWDCGFDFYAPQTFVDESGRTILIAWMGLPEADFESAPDGMAWCHCLTVPREVTAGAGGTLELAEHRADVLLAGAGRAGSLVLDDALAISWEDGTVRLTFADDRVGCGRDERAASVDAVRDLRVLVDSSAVEVFVNGGELALATRWFPRSERLTLVQRGQALLHIWEMGDGMAGTY